MIGVKVGKASTTPQVRLKVAPVPVPLVETCATGFAGGDSVLPGLTMLVAVIAPAFSAVTLRTTPLVSVTVSPTTKSAPPAATAAAVMACGLARGSTVSSLTAAPTVAASATGPADTAAARRSGRCPARGFRSHPATAYAGSASRIATGWSAGNAGNRPGPSSASRGSHSAARAPAVPAAADRRHRPPTVAGREVPAARAGRLLARATRRRGRAERLTTRDALQEQAG